MSAIFKFSPGHYPSIDYDEFVALYNDDQINSLHFTEDSNGNSFSANHIATWRLSSAASTNALLNRFITSMGEAEGKKRYLALTGETTEEVEMVLACDYMSDADYGYIVMSSDTQTHTDSPYARCFISLKGGDTIEYNRYVTRDDDKIKSLIKTAIATRATNQSNPAAPKPAATQP